MSLEINYKIKISKKALKDLEFVKNNGLKRKIDELLLIVQSNPFKNTPPYEKLNGDLNGAYSRRINVKHRLVYKVNKENKIIYILRMWTHYK